MPVDLFRQVLHTIMKHLLLLSLVLLVTLLPAQEVPVVHHPWQIGLVYAQDFMQPLETFGKGKVHGYFYTEDKSNFSFELSLIRHLNRSLAVKSGVMLSNRDVTGLYFCHSCDPQWEPASLAIRYLSIPVVVRYQFHLRRLMLYAETGFNTGFLLDGPADQELFMGRQKSGTAMIESISGIGATLRLTNRFSVQLGVQYTQTLYYINHKYGYDWKFRVPSVQAGFLTGSGRTRQD